MIQYQCSLMNKKNVREDTDNVASIFKELNIDEEEEKKIPVDTISDLGCNEVDGGQSPPLQYMGAECPSPSCSIDIPLPTEKEKMNDLHINGESMPRLQKASSVPQIHSGSPRRKKTSEASPLPDPMLIGNMMQENQILRDNVVKLKEKNTEIIAINHDWDKSYNALVQQHAELQKQFQKNNEQFGNEIVKKEEEKNRMKAKLERFFNEGSLDEKTLLAEEKEEKNKILKREQAALQTAKEFQMKCQHLDHILRQTTQQKVHLERELQHLSMCVESQQQQKSFAGGSDCSPQNHHSYNTDANEIDLLRHQLQTYVEDFDAEKNEKQRLLKESEELKRKLASKIDENEHLKTQLQIYEKDFSREREKRIQLMRKSNPMSRAVMPPAFEPKSTMSQEDAQKRQEYNSLVAQKEQIADRINNLENQNVNSWSNGGYNNGISSSLPPYPHSPAYPNASQSLPRSAPPYTYPTSCTVDRVFNEKAMQARGILSRSIPEKDDSGVSSINNCNNPTSPSNSWSYFGP